MTQKSKQLGLLFLIVALVSLVLLTTSLSNLQLRPGAPFPGGSISNNSSPSDKTLPELKTYSFLIQRGILALIFLVLVIYVPFKIITLVNRKIILRLVLIIGILILIGYLMPLISRGQPIYFPNESSETIKPPSFDYPVTPLGRPPQLLVWLVIIGILLGFGLLAIRVLKRWFSPSRIEDQLLLEAEEAVNALQAGIDLRNVIIRCYLKMSRLLQEEQGIERSYNMTVREFEEWLESKGLPAVPVHQLTSLFEEVRYGKEQMSYQDEKNAVESLNEIIQFCRSERG